MHMSTFMQRTKLWRKSEEGRITVSIVFRILIWTEKLWIVYIRTCDRKFNLFKYLYSCYNLSCLSGDWPTTNRKIYNIKHTVKCAAYLHILIQIYYLNFWHRRLYRYWYGNFYLYTTNCVEGISFKESPSNCTSCNKPPLHITNIYLQWYGSYVHLDLSYLFVNWFIFRSLNALKWHPIVQGPI